MNHFALRPIAAVLLLATATVQAQQNATPVNPTTQSSNSAARSATKIGVALSTAGLLTAWVIQRDRSAPPTTATASALPTPTHDRLANWSVGPGIDDLIERLRDLRQRKQYDLAHGIEGQAWFAEQIEIVKRALRSHHGSAGQKAALNEPGDYAPPH